MWAIHFTCLPASKTITLVFIWLILIIPLAGLAQKNDEAGKKGLTLTDELGKLLNIAQLPAYEDGASAETSTYDRTGGNDDGFDGTYSFLRRNADSSLVMFEAEGSGVITRIATPTPNNDTLDIYVNDTAKPVLSLRYADLFSGRQYPFVKPLCGNQLGGFYCYYPIMFSKFCRIVCRGKHLQFHQIQYTMYKQGAVAENFGASLTAGEKETLAKIARLWGLENPAAKDFCVNPQQKTMVFELKAGETETIFSSKAGGRVTGIELGNADVYTGLYKDVDIKITWDNQAAPAVYCPVADFFGYAFGKPAMQSLLAGTQNNKNYCYFPMPFDSAAVIQLIYRARGRPTTQRAIQVDAAVYYTLQKRDAQKEGRFYASWQGSAVPAAGEPHTLLRATGKGHYVATLLQAQGLHPGMTIFFEGDDSTAVDGMPAIHGTGSEDYFNGGWYAFPDRWCSRFSLPLHGALDYSLPYCRTGGYRLYLADKIPFTKSIYQSMEHGPEGNKVPAAYTTLSFYYCDTPPAAYTKPTNTLAEVYIPDTLTLYPQLLNFNVWGQVGMKPVWAYDTGGESFIFTVNSDSRVLFGLSDILPGKYKLFADFVKKPAGCSFSVWQRQGQVSGWVDTHDAATQRVGQLYLGDVEVNGFQNTVTLQFKAAGGNEFFLNRFVLVKE